MALAHAVLASLLDEPRTGYDLAKRFGTDGFFWRAAHQQIHRELARLEADGAIAATGQAAGPRRERRRAITPLPEGTPPSGPMLGRYLALRGGISYERARVEWADEALATLQGSVGARFPDGTTQR